MNFIFFIKLFSFAFIHHVESNVLTRALRNIPGVLELAYYPQTQPTYFNSRPVPNYRSYQSYSYNAPSPFMPPARPQYSPPFFDEFKPQYPQFKPKSVPMYRPNEDIFGECGYIPPKLTNYVANGENTENRLWPWYVQLVIAGNNKSESETLCGGTIIHKKFIITAAHCYDDLQQSKHSRNTVILAKGIEGGVRIRNGKKTDGAIKLRASRVVLHPDYVPTMTESEARRKGVTPGPLHDIAIIEIRHDNPDVYSKLIPVCLPSESSVLKTDTQCKIMGHGFMSAADEDEFVMPNILQMADVRISTNQECKNGVESNSIKSKINENTLCIRGPVHPCVGDSGGPLICAGESNSNIQGTDENEDYEQELNPDEYEPRKRKWYLCGVTSFAVSTDEHDRCGSYKSAVFGKVSNYIQWAREVINE